MPDDNLKNGPDEQYQNFMSEGRFMIQKCGSCSRYGFAPRVLCKYCGSDALHWAEPSGRARVYSVTVMRRKPERGGDYLYALMELEEGVRMISTVVGTVPENVSIGDSVVAGIERADAGPRVVFHKDEAR